MLRLQIGESSDLYAKCALIRSPERFSRRGEGNIIAGYAVRYFALVVHPILSALVVLDKMEL